MAKLVVVNHVTLDGVMQSPGRPDEDPRDGFAHGGWAIGREDPAMFAQIGKRMAGGGGLLLGRRTYEELFAAWHGRSDNSFSDPLERAPKYVVSRTLTEPLPWSNSSLLAGEAPDAVAELKREAPGDLTIFGSGDLIRSLMAAELIDEYLLMIHPLVLGEGRRLFAPGQHARLRLLESATTPTGVVIAAYRP